MKKIIFIFLLFYLCSNIFAGNTNKTYYTVEDNLNIIKSIETNFELPVFHKSTPKFFPFNKFSTKKFPTFWIVFIISAIGAFTLYGLAAGLIAVTIVYFVTKGNKTETKKAFWGFLIGLVVGLGIKLLTFLLI